MYNGLTATGKRYLAKCQAENKPITFTNIKIGNGSLEETENPEEFTAIKSLKKEVEIYSKEQNEDAVRLAIQFSNDNLEEGFYVREFGIYVDNDGVEELYWYINDGVETNWLPPAEVSPVKYKYYMNIIATNLESLIVNWTGNELWVNKEDFEKELAKKADREDQRLETNAKEIVEAINEIYGQLHNVEIETTTPEEMKELVNNYMTVRRATNIKEMIIDWDLNTTPKFTPEMYLQDDWGIGYLNIKLLNNIEKGKMRATFLNENLTEPFVIEKEVIENRTLIKIPNELFKTPGKVDVRLNFRNFEDISVGGTETVYFYIVAKEKWELIEPFIPEVTQKYAKDVIDELYTALNSTKEEFIAFVNEQIKFLTLEETQEIINKYKGGK